MSDLHFFIMLLRGETDKTGVTNKNEMISLSRLSLLLRMNKLLISSEHYSRLWASVGLNPRIMPGVK